jgi:hypothetical protein
MKDRLIYLVADPTGSDNVGAFLKAAGGEHLTSTLIGAKQTLDVNVVGDADDGVFAEDDASADLHKGQSVLAVRRDALAIDTSLSGDYGDFKTNDRGALWVAPVGNIDDGAADSEFPVKVGARADSVLSLVADADRVNVVSDLYRRVRVNDAPDVAIAHSQDTVDDSPEVLMGTALAGRKQLFVQNLATNQDIYVGGTGVLSTDGFQVRRGSTWVFDMGPNISMYAVAPSATPADIRQLELA